MRTPCASTSTACGASWKRTSTARPTSTPSAASATALPWAGAWRPTHQRPRDRPTGRTLTGRLSMKPLSAQLLPDAITDEDLRHFHALVALAARRPDLEALLGQLAEALGVEQVALRHPDAPPLPADRVVVAPLYVGQAFFGDLYVAAPPHADSVELAARLAFFAPAVALALGASSPTSMQWLATVQSERDRLEAVLEATNDAILVIDTAGQIVTVTPPFEAFTGIPRYTVLGHPVETLAQAIEAHPELPRTLANVLRALADNQTDSL